MDYTESGGVSEMCKLNCFDGLIPHGGVEIVMFSDGFSDSNFGVKFNSDLSGTIHITSNEKGVVLDNSYGLNLTNDPVKFVLDQVTCGHSTTTLNVEVWHKDCRLNTFGLLLCMKLFGGSKLITKSNFLVGNQSYSVRSSYTRRKCTDYRLASSSAEYFVCVVTCPLRKITRIYKPIASVMFLPRETDGLSQFTQEYDEYGFPLHELFQIYFDVDPTQPITPDVIDKARKHFGIRDAHDYGVCTDPFSTSIYESVLYLMIKNTFPGTKSKPSKRRRARR